MHHSLARLALSVGSTVLVLQACTAPKESVAPASPAAAPPAQASAVQHAPPVVEILEPYSCGTVERLHTWNGIFLGSQPAADDLRHAHENGVKTVMNLRPVTEDAGFDEAALVADLAMEYHCIPVSSPADLTDQVFAEARALLADASKRPVFFHCHSGNRVGAVWAAFRALDGGLEWDAALAEAKEVGLKSPALEQRAREYVEHVRASSR